MLQTWSLQVNLSPTLAYCALPIKDSTGVARNSLPSSQTVMCDWLANISRSKNVPTNNKMPQLISAGRNHHCRFGIKCQDDGKCRRHPGSSRRWTGGVWTGRWSSKPSPPGLSSSPRSTTRRRVRGVRRVKGTQADNHKSIHGTLSFTRNS